MARQAQFAVVLLFAALFAFACVAAAVAGDAEARDADAALGRTPRVRREWRALSPGMRRRVAAAFWTMKTTTTKAGRAKYGPDFTNYDEFVFRHVCSVFDTNCDAGHSGPSFMTFHRSFLLAMERSLLSIDPGIGAMPYWNAAFDAVNGTYRHSKSKYIFTDNFFGDWNTKASDNYAVKNGLFANWPVPVYTSAKFGKDSALAAKFTCAREQWFVPGTCNATNAKSTRYLRNHNDCTPTVARHDSDSVPNQGVGLGGSREIVYSEEDFKACTSTDKILSWMDWQACIDVGAASCVPPTKKDVARVRATTVTIPPNTPSGCTVNFVGTFLDRHGKFGIVNFLHAMVHLKAGLDLADVSTSPNDPGTFNGHHANVDRSNMIWQHKTAHLASTYWNFPRSRTSTQGAGRSNITIAGPYAVYASSACAADKESFPGYDSTKPWLRGTTLDETVNRGYYFTHLFDCTKDAVDAEGRRIRCTGEPGGYTHREILYWTAPGRSPYVYDVME